MHTVNVVPPPVAELEIILRLELGRDGAAAVVHREDERAVDELQDEVVPPFALDGEEDAGDVAWLHLHRHVKVQTHAELARGQDGAAAGTNEDAGFDLV